MIDLFVSIIIVFLALLAILFPVFLIIVVYYSIYRIRNFFSNKKTEIIVQRENEKIEEMDGLHFEQYCADILRKNGFSFVKVTQGSGDFGADIIAVFENKKYAIQCKRYEQNVGINAVQEVYASKTHYRTDIAVVLTNSYFTPAAQILAQETGVELWDRTTLIDFSIRATDNIVNQQEYPFLPYETNPQKTNRLILCIEIILHSLKQLHRRQKKRRKEKRQEKLQEKLSVKRQKNLYRKYQKRVYRKRHKIPMMVYIVVFVLLLFTFGSIDSQQGVESESKEQTEIIATPSEQADIDSPEITFSPTSPTNTHLVGNKLITTPVPTAFIVSELPDESYIGIMRKNANVRQYPDQNSNLIGSARAGERIKIIEPFVKPKWHKVLFDEKEAYISANYCIIQNYENKNVKD